VELVHYY